MAMHLVHGLTTLNKKTRKASKSKKLEKIRAEHEKWLKSMGVGKTTLPVNTRGQRVGINEIPDYSTGNRMTSDRVAANGIAREQMVYSGERKLLGVAVMHKSNIVPVFADKKEHARDIAQMRRS